MAAPSRNKFIALATLAYGAVGAVWIVGSDSLLVYLGPGEDRAWIALLKGMLFVALGALTLFILLHRVPDRESSVRPQPADFLSVGDRGAPWPPWAAYGFAVVCSLATMAIRASMQVPFQGRPLLILFMPGIILSALLGGLGPGLLATLLSALAVDLLMIPPIGSLLISSGHDQAQWLVLIGSGVLVSVLSETLHRLRGRAEARRRIQGVILDGIGNAVIATDTTGCVTYVNPAAEAIIGWAQADAVGRPLADLLCLLHESDRRPLEDPVTRALTQAEGFDPPPEPVVLVSRDGRDHPVRHRTAPIRGPEGRVLGVVMVIEDESSGRVAERILADERRMLRTVIDTLPDLVWLKDLDGRFVTCNTIFAAFIGRPEAEIIGRTDHDLIAADQADQFRANDIRAMATGGLVSNEEWITFAGDGRRVLLDTLKTPLRDAAGRVTGILGIGRDITARWRAETELRRGNEKLWRITATVPGMLYDYGLDHDGRPHLLFVSEYCRDIFEIEPEAAMADISVLRQLMVPEDGERMRIDQQAAAEAGVLFSCEVRIVTPSGRAKWVQFTSRPTVADIEGMAILRTGVAIDITDRKRTETALREKDTMLGEMSEIAHIGAWSFDVATRTGTWTDEVARIQESETGDQATVEMGLGFFHGKERDTIERALEEAVREGRPYDLELQMITAAGTHKWVRTIGFPVIEDGRVVRMRGTLQDITGRKMADLKLAAAEARLRLFVDNAPAALAMLDRDMRYLFVSRRWLADYRLECNDVIGCSHYEIFPDLPEHWKVIHRRCLAGATEKSDEDPFPRADGHIEWLHWEIRPWMEENGEIGGILIMSENVTERVLAREELRKLSLAVEQSPNGIQITNAAGKIEYVNTAFLTMTGYAREDLIGKNPNILSSGLTPAATFTDLWRTLSDGRPWQGEFINRRKNGEVFIEFAMISPIRDRDGSISHYLAIKDDITEKKRISQELDLYRHHLEDVVEIRTSELRATESKLRLILESSADGLYGIDTEGKLTFVNPAACTMLGYAPSDLLGNNAHQRLHHSRTDGTPYPKSECPACATLRDGIARRITDDVFWRADGSAIPVSFAVHPMIQDEAIVGAVVSFSDISARIAADAAREAALSEAQRLARLRRDFLANMSHEIRTPLNAVLGLAQIGRTEPRPERVHTLFDRILDAGQSLLEVVDDILDFSRIEAGKVTAERLPLALGAMIDRAVALVVPRAFSKGLRFHVDEATGLPTVIQGDFLRLSQVLGNLLSNAVKFTPSGGLVTLTVRQDGGDLVIEVSDSGIGMTPEQIGRLFQPFEQADGSTTRTYGGSGLGLSITRHLLTLMEGTIAVDSALGRGSTFTVRLPLVCVDSASSSFIPDPATVTLLGLDDDEAVPLAAALRDRGAVISRADDLSMVPDAEMVVVGPEIAADPASQLVLRKLAGLGRRLAVVVDPGSGGVPPALSDIALALDWPYRIRRLLIAEAESISVADRLDRPLTGFSVLAAEDNEVNRLVLEEMLSLAGADLALAANGREALEILARRGADGFDIVLTDIQMPEMDGYDLARQVSLLAPGLPVVGVTAHAMPEEERRCLEAGMVAHVTKPIHLGHLLEVVLRHRRVRGGGGSAVAGPAAATTEPVEALIDWAGLDRDYAGRAGFVARLAAVVIESHASTPEALRHAATAGDLARIGRIAHSLKGTAGNLRAESLRRWAADTEQAARNPGADGIALAEPLALLIERLLAEIAGHFPESESKETS